MSPDGGKHMRAAVITGADGFVGSNTVEEFLSHGVRVLALDMADEPRRLCENPQLDYRKCNVFDPDELKAIIPSGEYDTFVHFAWAGSAGPARADCELQARNALGTVACLKTAKELRCDRFVCAGSIMEREVETTVHERGSRPGMGYVYGTGKLLAHCLCKCAAADIGIDLIWPMITNAYGPGELSPRFVNTTLRKVIAGEPLEFTAATQSYDFVYISDVAKAFYLVAEYGHPFCEYVIGSGKARPLKEFVIEMLGECAPGVEPRFGEVPFTGTDMPIEVFSIDSLQRDCGFCPEVEFAKGSRKTMEWLASVEEGK